MSGRSKQRGGSSVSIVTNVTNRYRSTKPKSPGRDDTETVACSTMTRNHTTPPVPLQPQTRGKRQKVSTQYRSHARITTRAHTPARVGASVGPGVAKGSAGAAAGPPVPAGATGAAEGSPPAAAEGAGVPKARAAAVGAGVSSSTGAVLLEEEVALVDESSVELVVAADSVVSDDVSGSTGDGVSGSGSGSSTACLASMCYHRFMETTDRPTDRSAAEHVKNKKIHEQLMQEGFVECCCVSPRGVRFARVPQPCPRTTGRSVLGVLRSLPTAVGCPLKWETFFLLWWNSGKVIHGDTMRRGVGTSAG